jgi:protease IV
MSEGAKRRGCGCSLLAGMALALFIAALAAAVGFYAGRHGLSAEFGPGVGVLDIYGEVIDERPVLDQLDEITANPDVKAIVVRVDSPGGAIAAVEEIYNALERLKADGTPVVASMGSTSASGGYFVCLPANRIFANRSSLTGSIGVLLEFSSARDLLDKLGVKFETVASGEFKAMGSISEPLTDREREHLQGVINDFQTFFVETVSTARHMPQEQVRALADGRVFTGRQALDMGLVDELGDQETAIDYAASLAGLSGTPRVIRPSGPESSLWELLDRLTTNAEAKVQRHLSAPKFTMR